MTQENRESLAAHFRNKSLLERHNIAKRVYCSNSLIRLVVLSDMTNRMFGTLTKWERDHVHSTQR